MFVGGNKQMSFGGVYGVITTKLLGEAYKRRNGPKRIFAYNVPCTYIISREKTFFHKIMEPMAAQDRYFYEVIEEDKPCHLYIDLDVDLTKYPSIDVHDVKEMVCDHVEFGLRGMDLEVEEKMVADSSNEKKGSLHIIYRLKNRLWRNNAHVGAFMRSCMQRRVKNIPPDYEVWSLFVDMCVYSRNRLFRMVGCTKKHENRVKWIKGETFNYKNWLKSLIQPLHYSDELIIEANEPDGTPAQYMGARSTRLPFDYEPTVKGKLVNFANAISPVRGISYCPMFRTWSINLQKRDCLFKKARHSKNTMYLVIYRKDQSYRFKCWNQKYECCKSGATDKLPLPEDIGDIMKKYNQFPISPSINIG